MNDIELLRIVFVIEFVPKYKITFYIDNIMLTSPAAAFSVSASVRQLRA